MTAAGVANPLPLVWHVLEGEVPFAALLPRPPGLAVARRLTLRSRLQRAALARWCRDRRQPLWQPATRRSGADHDHNPAGRAVLGDPEVGGVLAGATTDALRTASTAETSRTRAPTTSRLSRFSASDSGVLDVLGSDEMAPRDLDGMNAGSNPIRVGTASARADENQSSSRRLPACHCARAIAATLEVTTSIAFWTSASPSVFRKVLVSMNRALLTSTMMLWMPLATSACLLFR